MVSNYSSWDLNIDNRQRPHDVDEDLSFLIDYAILAPSSHNSQPWTFKIKNKEISISPCFERRLTVSDSNDRQLYISLGCAIKNICVAADYFGLLYEIEYAKNENQPAAKIFFNNGSPLENRELIDAILTRTNNRNPFENRRIPESFLSAIKLATPKSIAINIIEEVKVKDSLAEIAIEAGVAAMNNPNFRIELSDYVKSNITESFFGMPGFGMGVPTPISIVAPTMIKYLNMNKLSAKKDLSTLKRHTPALAVISSEKDNISAWMQVGFFFQEIALRAEAKGIRTGMWAAPIQIGEYYQKIEQVLGLKYRPQAFFRMGYTNKVPKHSPRLPSGRTIK